MIYLWRKQNGELGMASDREDREAAQAADMVDNWEPGSNLEMMLDSAQMTARKLGLWENGWSRSRRTGEPLPPRGSPEDCAFPHGPLCIPRTEPGETEAQYEARVSETWQRATVREMSDGPYCAPIQRRRRIAR